jgi:sugar/nucleoside kinase (ribokinase family)
VVTLGVHIVDVLGRPVTHIPPGQGRLLLDEIRVTAAGTAAGTSVDLVKLGAQVTNMGAIGDDTMADLLTSLLDGYGVDTRLLARKQGLRTSAPARAPVGPGRDRLARARPVAGRLAEDL